MSSSVKAFIMAIALIAAVPAQARNGVVARYNVYGVENVRKAANLADGAFDIRGLGQAPYADAPGLPLEVLVCVFRADRTPRFPDDAESCLGIGRNMRRYRAFTAETPLWCDVEPFVVEPDITHLDLSDVRYSQLVVRQITSGDRFEILGTVNLLDSDGRKVHGLAIFEYRSRRRPEKCR